jgi:protein-export membrane protein SecD/preprotein translocase SecF subunit
MKHASTWPLLAGITLLTIFAVAIIWPGYPKKYGPDFIDYPEGPLIDIGPDAMRLGLDLAGGTYLLAEANLSALPPGSDSDQAMESVKDLMEERINAFGVSETEVTIEGRNRLAVQIPGISPEEAENLIGRTALLQFMEPIQNEAGEVLCAADDGSADFSVPIAQVSPSFNTATNQNEMKCSASDGTLGVLKWQPATGTLDDRTIALTGAQVRESAANVQPGSGNVVELTLNGEGSQIFEQITGRLVGYPLGIFLDDEQLTAPTVQQAISNSTAVISGFESLDEAKDVSKLINAGALPVPLTTIQSTEVDATLGDKTLVRGVQAGIIGIMAVMAFMILYYRLPGVLASMALFTYIVVVMALFKLGPGFGSVTITLAGIAGFVLSVGMAVDANILVFERMKEELRAGRSLATAIEHGFDRAWSSIRDSNVATLITCVILWWFGDQFNAALVKGFSVTLAIGVIISMFSAILVTRTLLRALVGTRLARWTWAFGADVQPSRVAGVTTAPRKLLDFVGRRWVYFGISALLLVPGLVSLAVPPSLEAGIEFSSGATWTLDFEDDSITPERVKDALADIDPAYEHSRVQRTAEGYFIIRTEALETSPAPPIGTPPPSERDTIEAGLEQRLGGFDTLNFNQVSEIVSSEIVRNAAIAIAFAAAAILVYITWAFRNVPKSYRYGIAAIVAALHDAIFVIGAFSILGKLFGTEVDSLFITGLLTVIGFSVHDTIVVFDRIRENVSRNPGVAFDEIVNVSLTETLARSINTSISVILAVVALLVLGAGEIDSLLLALLLGIIAGTYSSIFVASQILVAWEDGDFAAIWRRIFPGHKDEEAAPASV